MRGAANRSATESNSSIANGSDSGALPNVTANGSNGTVPNGTAPEAKGSNRTAPEGNASGGNRTVAPPPKPKCGPYFQLPPKPTLKLELNGRSLPDVCFNSSEGPHHVFVIGDWGGLSGGPGQAPVPADHRSKKFPSRARKFVVGVDDSAQQRVARQMMLRALVHEPDYVLNLGDSFYWGGIRAKCGMPDLMYDNTGQWGPIYEDMYRGPGIDHKPWLGVLGNHDYGGFTFTMGWDQILTYTWGGSTSTGRWLLPAQYWKVKVHYPGFSIEYYMVDTNVFDAKAPDLEMGHNICGREHNPGDASCGGSQGPKSVCACPWWFLDLWITQLNWMQDNLAKSDSDWQVVVTHFPPTWGQGEWEHLSKAHGIDLFVTGHTHRQAVVGADSPNNFLSPTAWIVSGGGGGITSEGPPDPDGNDDEYGFMELALEREKITIAAISHGGQTRSHTEVRQRQPDPSMPRLATNTYPTDTGACKSTGHKKWNAGGKQKAFLRWILGSTAMV